MADKKKFDLEFWKSSGDFFQKYNEQKSEVFRLFEELSNRFPKDYQVPYFNHTKGNKISQGYNLDGFPYQVLDLVRDFDSQHGFNIRILNWVGNGLYIFVYVGKELANEYLEKTSGSKDLSNIYTGNYPFRYSDVIGKTKVISVRRELKTDLFLSVFWEELSFQENFSDNLNLLGNKVDKAFEYTV